ncbi:MAG TPA: hypothetical protein PKE00_09215 [Planctomycetota bacterium]|nr:hypothetical protein [Planctomycetota bacterium]
MTMSAMAVSTILAPLQAQAVAEVVTSETAGAWRLEVRRGPRLNPRSRAPSHSYEVLRWAPGADTPETVFSESTTGRPVAFLRSDGLCFVDPVSAKPRIVFPDGQSLDYPLHVVGAPCDDFGYDDLHANQGGRVHFFGDDIVVVRSSNALMQIARFRVDVTAHTATKLDAILEVCSTGPMAQSLARASMPLEPMLRLGDVLLWVNRGASGRMQWERLEGPWRTRALHAYDLSRKQLVDVATLSKQLFLQHHEAALAFVEHEPHRHAVEFEAWIVRCIGECRLTKHFDRVLKLMTTARSATADWNGDGELKSDMRRLRRIYLDALQQLNG